MRFRRCGSHNPRGELLVSMNILRFREISDHRAAALETADLLWFEPPVGAQSDSKVTFADKESSFTCGALSRILLPTRLLPDLRLCPEPFDADVDTVARLGHSDIVVEVGADCSNSIAWATQLIHWLNNVGGRFSGIADCPVPWGMLVDDDGKRQVAWCPFHSNFNEFTGLSDEFFKYALLVDQYLSSQNCPLKPGDKYTTADLFAGLFLVPLLWFLEPDSNGMGWLDSLFGAMPGDLLSAIRRSYLTDDPGTEMIDGYCDALTIRLESRLQTDYLPGFMTDVWDTGIEYLLGAGVAKKSGRRKIPAGQEFLSHIYDASKLRLPVQPVEWEQLAFPNRLTSTHKLTKSSLYYRIPNLAVERGHDGVPIPLALSESPRAKDSSDETENSKSRYVWLTKTRTGHPTAFAAQIASSGCWVLVLPAGIDQSDVFSHLRKLGRPIEERQVVEAERKANTIRVEMTIEEVADLELDKVGHFSVKLFRGTKQQPCGPIPCLQFLRFLALWCMSQGEFKGVAYTTRKKTAADIGLLVIEGDLATSTPGWMTCVLQPTHPLTQKIINPVRQMLSMIKDGTPEVDAYLSKESFVLNSRNCNVRSEEILKQVPKLTVRKMRDVELHMDDDAIGFMKQCPLRFTGGAQPGITSGVIADMLDHYVLLRDGGP